MLSPEKREDVTGLVEIRQVFRASKIGTIAGCYVLEGLIKRTSRARLLRSNVVIWDGDPLELSSSVEKVMIDGVDQPLGNRQLRLRDRYRAPVEGQLPKAYDR